MDSRGPHGPRRRPVRTSLCYGVIRAAASAGVIEIDLRITDSNGKGMDQVSLQRAASCGWGRTSLYPTGCAYDLYWPPRTQVAAQVHTSLALCAVPNVARRYWSGWLSAVKRRDVSSCSSGADCRKRNWRLAFYRHYRAIKFDTKFLCSLCITVWAHPETLPSQNRALSEANDSKL